MYLADSEVIYSTATGTCRQKIGTQFWLAMYNRGFEGWTVWRKYDYPVMNITVDTGDPVPHRYTYLVDEQNLNLTNWMPLQPPLVVMNRQQKYFGIPCK